MTKILMPCERPTLSSLASLLIALFPRACNAIWRHGYASGTEGTCVVLKEYYKLDVQLELSKDGLPFGTTSRVEVGKLWEKTGP